MAKINRTYSNSNDASGWNARPSGHDAEDAPAENTPPKASRFTLLLLAAQAVLSALALLQLFRTQMLPHTYLLILAAALALVWVLVFACRRRRLAGMFTRILSLMLCATLAVGCVFAEQGLAALRSITSGALGEDGAAGQGGLLDDITGALFVSEEVRAVREQPFVVYLSGVDTRGELTEKARSDVNILAVVNPVTKRVALLNTPRDTYIELAGQDGAMDKLTHAGLYGVQASMDTLGNFYGFDVDYYVRINFAGFMSIVDALGGIDVYSDYTFTSVGSPGYYDPTDFTEGWNHLDGQAALAFARERHAFASGDIQRGINQMKVIQAILDKVASPSLLTSYSRLMGAIQDCFVTNLSSEQISGLVRMQLADGADWSIESFSLTGASSTSSRCYSAMGQPLYVLLPDEQVLAQGQALAASVNSGEPAPQPQAEAASAAASGAQSEPAAG